MNRLIELFIEKDFPAIFNTAMIKPYFPNDNIRSSLLTRANASGEIVRLTRGWYALNHLYGKFGDTLETLPFANQLCKNSYISLELALSFADFIPEGVTVITSVSDKYTKKISTSNRLFSYHRIPQRNFLAGVTREQYGYTTHLQAKPLKALADYVYVHKKNWSTLEPLINSLRIEEDDLATFTSQDFDELKGNYYTAPQVENFLESIREELNV